MGRAVEIFVILVACAIAAVSTYYLTQADEPAKIYDVDVTINNPNAGELMTSGGKCVDGYSFTCSVRTTADGYSFDGWFDGDVLMSPSQTYTFAVRKHITLEARYSIVYDSSFTIAPAYAISPATITMTSKYNVEIVQRTWLVEDVITGETVVNKVTYHGDDETVTFGVTGGKVLSITHIVEYSDGHTTTTKIVKIVDETVTKHFSWKYQKGVWSIFGLINNMTADWDPPLSFAWYYNALTSPLPRGGGGTMSSFVTYNDPTIRSLALELKSKDPGMDELALANYILKFVQSLPYEYDIDGKGVNEYWKLPAETVWEGKGDCEDHAFLYAALLMSLGYEVVLHKVNCYSGSDFLGTHMAVGVHIADEPSGGASYVTIGGERYYYCETTAEVGTSWLNSANVGYRPPDYVIAQTYTL